ncbi:MAG: hypothetical protein ACYC7D_09540 [Nitrososphaerales archaeon]
MGTTDLPDSHPEGMRFPVTYSSTASNFLIALIVILYAPLIFAPIILIPFDLVTATVIAILLLALAFGIYVFRGNVSKKHGTLVVSAAGFSIVGKKIEPFRVKSRGVTHVDEKTLGFTTSVLFYNRIYFESSEHCDEAMKKIQALGY